MKTLIVLAFFLIAGMGLSAQDKSPVPKIRQQMTTYFTNHPMEKVFLMTDKANYKPGETLWFRAFVIGANNLPIPQESLELFVNLYDSTGAPVLQDIFRISKGSAPGDFKIPGDLKKGTYSLVAYTPESDSPEEISSTTLKIDPQYRYQWIAETVAKETISIAGQPNELFVTLHDISGNVLKNTQLRYQLINGTDILDKGKLKTDENGKATVPITIPANTNGEPFICVISDTREEWKQEVFLPTNLDPVVITFYPEGGTVIPGILCKIGFTSFNKWGMPVEVEGLILNQEGKSISTVKTFTAGLGLFPVVNDGKQKFKLVISGKTGQNQSFELPAPNPNGLSLSVDESDAGFLSANLIFADQQKHAIALIVTKGKDISWAADVEIDGTGIIKIPAENLPQGINLLSVFSKEGSLLAGRMVFADKNQQLKINVQPEKSNLEPTGKMIVKVRLTDENNQPLAGNIAVAVTDKSRTGPARHLLDEFLLMGYEPQTPFSLVSMAFQGKIVNSALLDAYLISNRLKGFDWGKIRKITAGTAPDQNRGNTEISGIVTDNNGKRVNRAMVNLVNKRNNQIHTTTTNAEGVFSIPNLNRINSEDFSARATDPSGERELKVVLIPNFEARISGYIRDKIRHYRLLNVDPEPDKNYFDNNQDLFIKAPRQSSPNNSAYDNQRRLLSSGAKVMDVIKTMKSYKIVGNQIVFFGSENSFSHQGGALLVVDGQQLGTDISVIQSLAPSDIDHINVSTNPSDIQKYTGLNSVGVIEIFLKKGPPLEEIAKTKNQYDGKFRVPTVFSTEPVNPKRDFRTTLMWIPEQQVDGTGQFEFSFTGGKVLSDFIIEVQGISENGRSGSGSAGFTVNKPADH